MAFVNITNNTFNPYSKETLNEGQFSWMTYDTDKQIGSEKQNTINVYMYDNEGNQWFEKKYDGYGEFGGMDYYALLAKMNGYSAEDITKKGMEMRDLGIDLAFNKLKTKAKGGKVLFPALVEDPKFNWKRHDFTKEAESDENQSWYQEPDYDEEEDDDYENGWYESLKTNEGAMSEIHLMAKEAKDAEDFKKQFYKEYGTKIKKSGETDKWIKELYVDATNESVITEAKTKADNYLFKKDDLVYNNRTETVGIVRIGDDGSGEVKTDADGNVNADELEDYMPFKFNYKNAKIAQSTKKEVIKRRLFYPFNESVVTEAKIKITKNEWPYLEFKDGGKTHKVEFDYEDIIDDHGNEGQDQYWLGKDDNGQEWMIDVYASSRGDVEEVHYDTIVKESVITEGLDKNKPYFDFLVALRDSGATNMFGATPYLQDEFGLSKSEARKILSEWMKSFNEATVVMDAMDPGSKILAKLLKKHKVTMEIIDNEGPAGWPEVELTGDRKDLEKVLASEDGWDDADLAEYIEESNGTHTVKVKSLNEAKSKFKIGDRVSVLSRSSKKPFDSGEVTGIQKDGTILINGLETISHEVAIDAELVVKESVVTESKLTWDSLKESLGINEGRSINKVSKDLEKTVLDMKKTVDEWKEAEGDRKSELLEKLRELNKRKAELEAELNDAVAGKDHDLQLALKEAEELAYLELDVKNIFENEQA